MAEIFLRAARPSDAEAVAALQSLPGVRFGTLRLLYPSAEDIAKWLARQSDHDRDLVVCADVEIIAIGGLHRSFGRRGHVGSLGMAVHDGWIGKGIGTRLLTALVDRAENWLGLTRIELTVFTDNASAIALYRKFRFEVEGTHWRYALRDGVLVDAFSMARLKP